LLSYCEEDGTYIDEHAQVLQNPYKWMASNRENTIELNSRDSEKFDSLMQQKLVRLKDQEKMEVLFQSEIAEEQDEDDSQ
jgi:hypothetical protein